VFVFLFQQFDLFSCYLHFLCCDHSAVGLHLRGRVFGCQHCYFSFYSLNSHLFLAFYLALFLGLLRIIYELCFSFLLLWSLLLPFEDLTHFHFLRRSFRSCHLDRRILRKEANLSDGLGCFFVFFFLDIFDIPLEPLRIILLKFDLLFLFEEVVRAILPKRHSLGCQFLIIRGEPGRLPILIEGIPLGRDHDDFSRKQDIASSYFEHIPFFLYILLLDKVVCASIDLLALLVIPRNLKDLILHSLVNTIDKRDISSQKKFLKQPQGEQLAHVIVFRFQKDCFKSLADWIVDLLVELAHLVDINRYSFVFVLVLQTGNEMCSGKFLCHRKGYSII
jgi:hypothetical protein